MATADVWYTSVYTSEIGFALHLPALINIHQKNVATIKPANRHFQLAIACVRIVCNIVAAGLLGWVTTKGSPARSAPAIAGWAFLGISVLLYIISYAHTSWALKQTSPGSLPIQPRLYLLAHLSILNFMLDVPGRRVPTVKISHSFLIVFNTLLSIYMFVLATAVTPIREAWRCYRPEHFDSIEDYNFGICPPPDKTTAICSDHAGITCPTTGEPSYSEAVWSTEMHYALNFILASGAVYLGSLKPKLLYWQLKEATDNTREQFYSALKSTPVATQ
jgi:hypothetical protein